MKSITSLAWIVIWAAGAVLAKGFWSTVFSVCTGGLWSLYLVVERVMQMWGVA